MSSDKELASKLRDLASEWGEPETNDGRDYHPDPRINDLLTAADRLDALASAGEELETTVIDRLRIEREARSAVVRFVATEQAASEPGRRLALLRDVDRQAATIATLRQQIEAKDKALEGAREWIDSKSWEHNFNCDRAFAIIDAVLTPET